MTDADKAINPQHFGSDPADIRIRIQINPKIRIRVPDHSTTVKKQILKSTATNNQGWDPRGLFSSSRTQNRGLGFGL